MNRTACSYFLKSLSIVLIFALHFQAISQKTFYTNFTGTKDFANVNNWRTQANGQGLAPTAGELNGTTLANFVVQSGANITMPNNSIKIASLYLGNSCNVFMTQCILEVTGDVSFEISAVIDFGTLTSSLTVDGNLNGGMYSTIRHAPGSKNTQKLILKGVSNTLDIFENWFGASDGYSIVSYEGGNQNVFTEEYATLIIAGSGIKTLKKESFNSSTLTVRKRLELREKLQLGANDLTYSGTNDSLVYYDANGVTGWIWTDETGVLKNTSAKDPQTFPVGDGATMKALDLSGLPTTPNLVVGVRYKASEPNMVIPPNSFSTWVINSNNPFTAKTTLINPAATGTILSTHKIASSPTGVLWNTYVTSKPEPTANVYEANTYIRSGNNYVALFDCTPPAITPATLPIGFQDRPYSSQNLEISQDKAPYKLYNSWSTPINNELAPSLVPFTNNILQITGNPTAVSNYELTFIIIDKYGCETTFIYNIDVRKPLSPNLYINPIDAKTYGDADFKVSAYTKNTATPIVYSISPTTACVTLLPNNTLHITCAGPAPNNSITVTAAQAANGIFKAESVTTTFIINRAQAKLSIKNTGFLPNASVALISEKNSDGLLTFTQLTGSNLATVSTDGKVSTSGNTGTFSVLANIAETNNYTGFDSIYVFTIYTTKQAPVAVNDTIIIQMGQDTTLNLVLNDYGITDPINAMLTDIDMENTGLQKKYYSTSLGTFTIDPTGILSIKPFDGFIGTEKIGYTITDEGGITSEIAYLQITVEEPFKLPDLKGNEIITLNNDGLNEALVIANTNIESTNSIIITDVVGNIIFEQDNYQNDWKGTNKEGNKISSGVYLYVFTEKKTGRMLQNHIEITR